MSDDDARSYAWRTAVFYAAIFLVLGVSLPYLPLWLEWRGLSAVEIGIITSVPLFLRLVATPVIGLAADRGGRIAEVLQISAIAALGAACGLWLVPGFWLILILFAAFQTASTALMPLADVVAMRGVRQHGLDYGTMRLWGSAAFIVANVGGGWVVAVSGSGSVLPLVIAGSMAAVAAAWLLPRAGAGPPAARSRRRSLGLILALLRRRDLILLILAAGSIQASHATYYVFSAIHWEALGIGKGWFGVLWAIGVIAEIVLFAYAAPVVARVGAVAMIFLGGAAAALRWVLMAADPGIAALVPLQVLHGLSFGATHLGAVHAIQAIAGEKAAASAQTLHSAMSAGVLMALSTLFAGLLYEPLRGQSYLVMGIIALAGASLALIIHFDPRGPLSGTKGSRS